MSSEPTTPDGALTRRRFMKIGAAGGVAAVGLGGAGTRVPGPVGQSKAVAPLLVYGGAVGASIALGWLLRETETIGSNPPAEGLTPEVLQSEAYNTVRKRQSNNKSTFVDNRNIVETGYEHSLYSDGKIAAIEALNDEKTESEVLTDAEAAVDEYATTVQRNLLKSWNESINEFSNLVQSYQDHADLDPVSDITNDVVFVGGEPSNYWDPSTITSERDITLPDGETFTVKTLVIKPTGDSYPGTEYGPTEMYVDNENQIPADYYQQFLFQTPEGNITYLSFADWNGVWSTLTTALSNVKTGLDTWVTNVYGEVQAGELDTADLLTARERAEMSASEEGSFDQAVADLHALNISTDLKREAEIYLPDIDATVKGQLGVTSDISLSTGTVDPSADAHDYYLTYDVSQGQGTWSAFNSGIDGGVLTFTQEPFEQTEYDISTNAGETVTVTASDFTDQGDGTYTADLSDQLETDIAEVDSVEYYATTSETQFETVQLTDTFEIVTFTDTETGEEHDTAEVTSGEPQDDTNYITEEEWADMEARQQELIDKYEESLNSGGGGFLSGDNGGIVGIAVMAALGGAAFLGR